MNYNEAKIKLEEYFKTFKPDEDNEYTQAMYKAYEALNDCLKRGLKGEEK